MLNGMREVQFQSVCTWENSAELLIAVLKSIWQNTTFQKATVLWLDPHKWLLNVALPKF